MIGLFGSGSARDHACLLRLTAESGNAEFRFYHSGSNAVLADHPSTLPVSIEAHRATARQAAKDGLDLLLITDTMILQTPVADAFVAEGISVLGPSLHAAQLEGSKGLMKKLVADAGVPNPESWRFSRASEAKAFLTEKWSEDNATQFVVKTDRLIEDGNHRTMVPKNLVEGLKDVDEELEALLLAHEPSGFVVESRISGFETSVHILWDGDTYILFPPVRDYKPVFDGDTGPNTNGTGALACGAGFSVALEDQLRRLIIEPLLEHLNRTGYGYRGFLYLGIMLTDSGPQLIEINVRPGNPELVVLLPLLRSSFVDLITQAAAGKLHDASVEWDQSAFAGAVFAMARNYPETEEVAATPIEGLEPALKTGKLVTEGVDKSSDGQYVVGAGRVAAPFAVADSVEGVREQVFRSLSGISFDGKHFRSDLGFGVSEALFRAV